MKKKFLVGLLAVVMCFALVGCGKTENGGSSNNGGSTNNGGSNSGTEKASGLNNASKDNYVSLLKEYYGIEASDFEESGFNLQSVEGSESSKRLKLTYSTNIDDTFKAQDAYKTKFFNMVKTIGGGSITAEGKTFTDYEKCYSDTEEGCYPYSYSFNGRSVKTYVESGSIVWIQLEIEK